MRLNRFFFITFAAVLLNPLSTAFAFEKITTSTSLPEPLTLDLALSLIEQQHPDLRYSNANVQNARSDLALTQSENDLTISLNAEARFIKPTAIAMNQSTEEQRLVLQFNKTLYDFGRSSARIDAASQQLESQNFQYLDARQQQHLIVLKRYFDVVLADLQFYRYNEEMAVAYIRFDRKREREKLGQNTELDVAETEVEYQRVRYLRTQSENQQRVTRSLLAQSLNRPDDLPATVTKPELDIVKRKLPEIENLQKKVKYNNPILSALRAKLVAAKKDIQYAHASDNPLLIGGFEAFEYAIVTNIANEWQANVVLNVPLWSGNKVDAAVAKAKAAVYKVEAQLAQQELAAQQQVLELWLSIEALKIKYDEVLAAMNFSELSLDKNRALYELEVKADLGYAMVKFSEAERKVAQTSFEIALAWAQLDALSGTLLTSENKKLTNTLTGK